MPTIAVGTEKGAFFIDSATQKSSDPVFPGWKVTAFGRSGDRYIATVGSNWFGVGVHHSTDMVNWTQTDSPPTYAEERPLDEIWTLHDTDDHLFAGVAEAGLFRSADHGDTWEAIPGLNDHPTRDQWLPGFGGLCAHRVLTAGDRIWVAISAVGVFRSDDGGDTFDPKNSGVTPVGDDGDGPPPEIGYCVHRIVAHPNDPDLIWRQDHRGMYRTRDGGDNWEKIETGLPSGFGFAIVREGSTGRLFVAPLHSDERRLPVNGEFRVYRSHDDGNSWEVSGSGWPEAPTHTSVLRGAIDADDRGHVAIGTTSGNVWLTSDSGDTWTALPHTFPRIGAITLW